MERAISFAHLLDRVDHPYGALATAVLFFASLTIFVGSRYLWDRKHGLRERMDFGNTPIGVKVGFSLGVVAILPQLLIGELVSWAAYHEIQPRLFARVYSIALDGKALGDLRPLMAALRGMQVYLSHHSSPTKWHRLELSTARGPLFLYIARDSSNPYEFWVDNPSFYNGELRRHVFTQALDPYI